MGAATVLSSNDSPDSSSEDSGDEGPDFLAIMDSYKAVPVCCTGGGYVPNDCQEEPGPGRGNTGTASFWLDEEEGMPVLSYEILVPGLDLDGWVTGPASPANITDDVAKIHLHIGYEGEPGPKAINILGAPCQDDHDLKITPFEYKVEGKWDKGDLTDDTVCPGVKPTGLSRSLEEMLPYLCAGRLHTTIHTEFCIKGELRGQVEINSNKAQTFCDEWDGTMEDE